MQGSSNLKVCVYIFSRLGPSLKTRHNELSLRPHENSVPPETGIYNPFTADPPENSVNCSDNVQRPAATNQLIVQPHTNKTLIPARLASAVDLRLAQIIIPATPVFNAIS